MTDRGLRRLLGVLADGANCLSVPLDVFFPEPRASTADALLVCSRH